MDSDVQGKYLLKINNELGEAQCEINVEVLSFAFFSNSRNDLFKFKKKCIGLISTFIINGIKNVSLFFLNRCLFIHLLLVYPCPVHFKIEIISSSSAYPECQKF